MDILNFISWIKGKRQFTTIDPAQSVLPVGIKDPKRDDNYLTGAVTVEDFADIVAGVIPPGPAGPQGIAGPAGVPGPVGPAGLEWQGSWVSGTSYVEDDAVGYDGASWFCILATSGTTTPDLDTTHWALLASEGAVGPQGPQGPTGPQGPSGNPISYLEYNDTYKSVWNNGFGNVGTNTSFGDQAIASNNTSAAYNTGVGFMALRNNSNGQYNTAIGGTALVNTQGNFNTGLGYSAGFSTGSAANVTAVGAFALQSAAASNNTGVGYEAGKNITTGTVNTVFGSGSALTLTTGTGNVIIGQGANTGAAGTNYSVAIGQNAAAGTFSTVIGSGATAASYTGSTVLGVGAAATGNNQFVVGSSAQAAGAVTTETVSSTRTWTVVINGTTHKILLA
jgi:hypothetical protein